MVSTLVSWYHWYQQQTSWLITNIINCWWITGYNGRSTAAHLQPLHQLHLCYVHVPHESHDLRSSTATVNSPLFSRGATKGGKVHGRGGQHQGIKGGLVDDFTKGAHGVPSWLVQLICKFWKLHGWWLKHGNLQSGKLNRNWKSSGQYQKTLSMDTPRWRIMDSRSNHGELDVALLFFSEQRPQRLGTDGVLNGWFVLENRTLPLNSYEAKPLLKHQGNMSIMLCHWLLSIILAMVHILANGWNIRGNVQQWRWTSSWWPYSWPWQRAFSLILKHGPSWSVGWWETLRWKLWL